MARSVPYTALCLALCAAVLACGKPKRPKKPEGPPPPKITGFTINGNQLFSDQEIFDRIQSGPPPRWSLKRTPRFDESVFRTDLDRIESLYRSRGYFDARISSYKVNPIGNEKVELLVEIEEGLPVEVSSVRINFTEGSALPPTVEDYVVGADPKRPFPKGAQLEGPLLHDNYLRAREELLTRLLQEGYAQAKVQGQIRVNREALSAEVVFTVDPGLFSEFGTVTFEGLSRLQANDLYRYLAFERREPFDSKKLANTQRNLYETGSFAAVNVEPEFVEGQAQVNIRIKLEEVQRHRVQLGAGAGIDATGRSDVHLRLGWLDRSFFGGLTRFQASGLVGIAFLDSGIAPLTNTGVTFSRPGFLKPSQSLSASLNGVVDSPAAGLLTATLSPRVTIERNLLREMKEKRERDGRIAEVDPGKLEPHAFTVGYGYAFQLARLCFLSGEDAAFCSPNGNLDDNALLALGLNGNQQTFQLGYLEQYITYNRTNDPVDPRAGYTLSLNLHEGLGVFAFAPNSGFNYMRIVPEARSYLPLVKSRRLVLATRLQLGMILSLDPLLGKEPLFSPFPERFFLGGATSHRGFGFQGLSPVEQFSDTSGAIPVGGDGLFLLSNELRLELPNILALIKIPGQLRLTTFFDLGAVAGTVDELLPIRFASTEEDAQGALRPAGGGGIRYVYGPIVLRVDYARLLGTTLDGEPAQKFHISVGEAF